MSNCVLLRMIKSHIDNGERPEEVIPYSLPAEIADSDYLELLYYARQILPDGERKDFINKRIEELVNAGR